MSVSNAVLAVILSVCIMPVLLLIAAFLERRSASRHLSTAPMGSGVADTPLPAHTACRIYTHVERENEGREWGRILDAGTGAHSLAWIGALEPRDELVAVTGEPDKRAQLSKRGAHLLHQGDRVVSGNWLHADFLKDEQFDTILADYLLGSIDGFAPYFQTELFARLRPHLRVGGRLYVVGLEPLPITEVDSSREPAAELLLEVARVRDACVTLAGRRPYREYPLRWAAAQLERAGFRVLRSTRIASRYSPSFIRGQIAVARRMLGLARARLSSSRVGQGALTPAARVWSLPARFAALGDGSSQAIDGLATLLETLSIRVDSLPKRDFTLGSDYIISATVDNNSHSDIRPLRQTDLRATPLHLSGLDW